jgi:hypothetical protein
MSMGSDNQYYSDKWNVLDCYSNGIPTDFRIYSVSRERVVHRGYVFRQVPAIYAWKRNTVGIHC